MMQKGIKYCITKEALVRTENADFLTETGAFTNSRLTPPDTSNEMSRLLLTAMVNPPALMSEPSI